MKKTGGSYEIIDGEKVLKNRTGWTPKKVSRKGKKETGRRSAAANATGKDE